MSALAAIEELDGDTGKPIQPKARFWAAYGLFPRITLRLVRWFVIPAVILTLLAAVAAAAITHYTLRKEAQQSMVSRMTAFLDSATYIADTLDADMLEMTTANFLKAPNVSSVEVRVHGLPPVVRANQTPKGWFSALATYEVVVNIPPYHGAPPDAEPIGQLKVTANYARVMQVIVTLALSSAASIIIVSTALVFLVLVFVRRNSIEPLMQFAAFIGGAQARLVVPKGDETEADAYARFCRDQVMSVLAKEARLSALVSNVPGIALRTRVHETKQDLLWISDGIERILGYPAHRLVGPAADLRFSDLIHPEDMELNRPIVRSAWAHMRSYEFKLRVLTALSGYKWMLARGRPLIDIDGHKVTETLLVDIDDQVRKEQALEESERRLSATLGNVAGIAVRSREINGVQTAVWINDGIETILGIPAHALIGPKAVMRLRDLFHPEDNALHAPTVDANVRALRPYEFKIRLRTASGDYKWMLARGRPTVEPSGDLITETLLVEIDEQVKKEQWLAAVVAALDSSQDRIIIESPTNEVVYANRAAAQAARNEGRTIVGKRLSDVFPDTQPLGRQLYRRIRSSIRKHGQWRDTVVFNRRSGASTIHDVRVGEIPGGGLLYAATDITEIKARAAREAELQAQLAETQKMESLGRLAGGVAHDFNNILAATRAFADLIAGETPEGSRPHTYAGRIVTASQRAANLVNQILTFSRAQDALRELLSLSESMAEAETILRGRLPAHTTLNVQPAPPDTFIMANAGQVAQIILNLAINASDALNGRGGTVDVTTSRMYVSDPRPSFAKGLSTSGGGDAFFYASAALKPGTDYVCLTCADDGSGIAPDIALKIFDPFFTTKEKRSGSGLGLAVVNSIVVANDGVITVRSRLGEGTTFDIYWPAYNTCAEPVDNVTSIGSAAQPPLDGCERVLIVDDEVDVADALSLSLRRLGYRTTVCINSLDALEAVKSAPQAWDVVISDQIMPNLRGLDLIQRMKEVNPRLKAILCTGYSDKSGEEGALLRGADLFFMKPTPITALAAGIRQLMNVDLTG
ncbi:MAG: PAS domain-containing protein [Rhodospirillaceae bacterium]|nr:PAS domain-containing protein [Rhodospirillaceae bacterium]